MILACASSAPLSSELNNDFKWKSVDLNKDGQPDVVPLPLTPEFNHDLQWKSVDLNKDGQPDVNAVVEEAKVADIATAEVPQVEAKAASEGYAITIQTAASYFEAAPDVKPIVEAVPVAEEAKLVVPVVDASAVESSSTVEVAPVADSVIVQSSAAETPSSVVDPVVEAVPLAEEAKVVVFPVVDAPTVESTQMVELASVAHAVADSVVEASPVVSEGTKIGDASVVSIADTPVALEATPEVELKSPEPVQDTPEIQEAKAVFFRLYEEAAAAAAAVDEDGNPTVMNDLSATERKTRQAVSYYNPSIVPYTFPSFFPAAHPFSYRARFPYTFPFGYPTVTAKNDRKKRQVPILPSSQLYNDLIYKSVDLNQDGQPDKAVITTPQTVPAYLPYTGYPYSAYYPYAYPFAANGLYF